MAIVKRIASEEYATEKASYEANEAVKNIPQSDWEQSDENAVDFIKNKPFYDINVSSIIYDGQVKLIEGRYYTALIGTLEKEVLCKKGNTYKAIFNNENNEFVCQEAVCNQDGHLTLYVQNSYFYVEISGDYIDIYSNDDYFDYDIFAEGIYNLKIEENGTAFKALDEKFIPDTIARAEDIPTDLPNPHKLTFTGAVNAEYDGSKEVKVEIPESGGIEVTGASVGQTIVVKAVDENGKPTEWKTADLPQGGAGGNAKTEKLLDVTFTEATASISVTLEHNFHKLFLVWRGGENVRTVDAEGVALSGNKLGVIFDGTSFGWNSRKVGMIGDSGRTWATDTLLMEWTEDLSTYLGADCASISTGVFSYRCSHFGGESALLGTVAASDAMAPISGSEICIALQTGFFAPNTRIVLVGEYFE